MDPRLLSVLDALDACANEMKAHADWMEHLLRRTYALWAQPGEFESNMVAVTATRQHGGMMGERVVLIERNFLEAGDHSRRCGKDCVSWCRAREPRVVPKVEPPKPEPEPPMERFELIELE